MANVFSGLSEKLNHVFTKLTKRGTLTELEIKQAMREIRIALLEADVNLLVAKDFVSKVSEKALGQSVLKSLSPSQQVIKIVSDELTELMDNAVHIAWATGGALVPNSERNEFLDTYL